MSVAPATRRTFYIERYGDRYELVRVWEKGETMKPDAMLDYALKRVFETAPDERIIAEQSITVVPTPRGARIVSE